MAVWMELQLTIAEMNLSPRKCEQMEETNAREEILLVLCYFVLRGTVSVPEAEKTSWNTKNTVMAFNQLSFYYWASNHAMHYHQLC